MATKTNRKGTMLSVSEKLQIIRKEFSLPGLMLNHTVAKKKNILQQRVTTQPDQNKLRTSKSEMTESVLLEWFGQKLALYKSVQSLMMRKKAESKRSLM
jgi:hypothetical protein